MDNNIYSHEDMLPTLLAAAGVPDVKEQLLKGMKVGDKSFKVHLDGYNITDSLAGKGEDPRKEIFYFNDDGSLVALRYQNWKVVFQEQRAEGLAVWEEPFVTLRLPKIFNLRSDPFETADRDGIDYPRWRVEHTFVLYGAASLRRPIPAIVQGVSAEPARRQLLARQRDEDALSAGPRQRLTPRL